MDNQNHFILFICGCILVYILYKILLIDIVKLKILHSSTTYLDKFIKWSFEVPSTHRPDIRIITTSSHTGSGTDSDAEIYHKLFPGSTVIFVDYDDIDNNPDISVHFSLNIYIEKPLGLEKGYFPSTRKWLMVNQEMLVDEPSLRKIDLFICKSRYAESCMKNYRKEKSLPGRIVYTRHSSNDIGGVGSVSDQKDYNTFVHFAGKSWLKGTSKLINTWIVNEGFKELGSPTLIVTCYGFCLSRSNSLKQSIASSFELRKDGSYKHKDFPNIIIAEKLDTETFERIQRSAGFFLCPSEVEGYGHYINEGRSCSSVVITIDALPMNELVDESSGFLIEPVHRRREGSLKDSYAFLTTKSMIAKCIRRAKSIPIDILEQKRINARKRYEEDTLFMANTLLRL